MKITNLYKIVIRFCLSISFAVCLFNCPAWQVYGQSSLPSNLKTNLKKCWENRVFPKDKISASDNQVKNVNNKNNDVFLLTNENKIYSIDSESGNVNWIYETGGKEISNLLVIDKTLFVAGVIETVKSPIPEKTERRLFLRGINADSGIPFYYVETALPFSGSTIDANVEANVQDEKITYIGHLDNDVFIINSDGNLLSASLKDNSKTGSANEEKLNWLKKFYPMPIRFFDSASIKDETSRKSQELFAFDAADQKLYLFELPTGNVLSQIPHKNLIMDIVLSGNNQNLIMGDNKGSIFSRNLENNGKAVLWETKIGGGISSLSLTEKGVLVTSLDNFIYLFNHDSGGKLWKKRLSGRILYQPLIVESKKLFVVIENDAAYFSDLDTGEILTRIVLPTGTYFTNTPFFYKGIYIFQTNVGIYAYSGTNCA